MPNSNEIIKRLEKRMIANDLTIDQIINFVHRNMIDSDFDLDNYRIINVADPIDPQDAATKHYVDDIIAKENVISPTNPTVSENLLLGTEWRNTTTGEIFVCIDNTPDSNKWVGQLGTTIFPTTTNIVDIFNDGSGIALFQLDGNANDTGGLYDGRASGVSWGTGKYGQCVYSGNRGHVKIPLKYTGGSVLTVSFWAKWSGAYSVMPIGFDTYDLYLDYQNYFGFNSGHSDVYGLSYNPFNVSTFVHVVAEFHEYNYTQNKIWINGEPQTLAQRLSSPDSSSLVFQNKNFYIFGWGADKNYRRFGYVDQLRIFNRALTDSEVSQLYNEM